MKRLHALKATLGALAVLSMASLAAPALADEPGDDLTIYALTFGPGDHPFFKFGHNAIWVQPKSSQGLVYNFGTFAFDSPALIPKFLRGKFMYWLSVAGFDDTVESYRSANRSILAQELDLTPDQRVRLWQALRLNARPENREYLYDYFYDNCSTRVRDAIDRVVDGRVRLAGSVPAQMTFRDDAMRMTADLWWEAVAIDLAIGRPADIPIDHWNEAFLPERLAVLLRTVRIPDGPGEKNLVKAEKMIFQDSRPPEPVNPPSWTVYFLLTGLVIGGLLFGLGRLGRFTLARIVFGCFASLLGAVSGFIGLALLLLWGFTNHRIAYANANIIQFAPWIVVLLVYGLGVALGRLGAIKRARLFALSAAISSLVGLIAKAIPGLAQSNWPFIALCLPVWAGLWAGMRSLARSYGEVGASEGEAKTSTQARLRRRPAKVG
jgi:hypothetical protein